MGEQMSSQSRSIIHDGTLVTNAPIRRLSLSLLCCELDEPKTQILFPTKFLGTYQTFLSVLIIFKPLNFVSLVTHLCVVKQCPKIAFSD